MAIDAGLNTSAFVLFSPYTKKIIGGNVIHSKGNRYVFVARAFRHLFTVHKPTTVVLENAFKEGGKKPALHHKGGIGAAINLAKGMMATGVVLGVAEGMNIPLIEVSVQEWNPTNQGKKNGNIKLEMIRKYNFKENMPLDFFDACALADYSIRQYWLDIKTKTINLLKDK
jgi:hypothetical protein